jgi:lipoprotein-releasing system permease protein
MLIPLEFRIGYRYTRARRKNNYISFISLISVLGIVVGVWALITVLSVMNGFERELRERILAAASHLTVTGRDDRLNQWAQLGNQLSQLNEVIGFAPYILGQGMLTSGGRTAGVLIRGIVPEREQTVSSVLQHLQSGDLIDFKPGKWGVVLGSELAGKLGVEPGDKVTVIAPQGRVSIAGVLPRLKRFTVTAIFELGMYEYDSALALIHIDDAAQIFQTQGSVSGIRLSVQNAYHAPLIRLTLEETLGSEFLVRDWTREHQSFFRALQIERRVMFLILFLIVAVAAFNIVSTLVMVVTDKQTDVAILRTLGFSARSVMAVFMAQGVLIGLIGTIIGGLAGVATTLNLETLVPFLEGVFRVEFFPANIYVISDFPAEMRWRDVGLILCVSLTLTFLATLYPAWRASRVQPAEALRYE